MSARVATAPASEPASLTLRADPRYGPAVPPAMLIVGDAPSAEQEPPLALSTRDLVIRLRYEEGLSFPGIARRLGVTRAWVYMLAADERLRRGKDKGASAEDLGCLVCGVVPKATGKLRANGLCGKHAHRLEKYGDAEIELPCDRPSVCQSCGVQCGQRGAGASADTGAASMPRVRSGRILGADGVYRCQRCAWREDIGFRARHRESAKRWKARARGKRILGRARLALGFKMHLDRLPMEEFLAACEVLDAAWNRLEGEGKS